jgi:hypothetical protein
MDVSSVLYRFRRLTMTVVDHNIGLRLFVRYYPKAANAMTDHFLEVYRALQVAVTQQTESKEGISDPFREEYPAHTSRYVCKGITHTSNDDVLKDCCIASEGRPLLWAQVVTLVYELDWQL